MQMMNKGMRYEKYKDSGAEWLGEIPNNWDSIKMKHLFQDVSIKKKADAELLSVTQDQGVVPRTLVENRMVMPSGALESFKFINKGDFAISLRSFEGGLEYCHHDGIISPAYTVLKAKRTFESKFYKYLFKSFSFISELQTSVVGIRQGKNISFEELSYSYLPIPPLPEQTAIAAFLDRKTTLIDQAIDIKQKQIELLIERRQILIHKAVTRGLKTNVKMKDSGVEWIGEIPEHWEVKRLKHVLNINNGADYKHVQTDEGFPVIGSGGQFAYASEFMYDGEVVFLGRKGTIDKPLYFNGKFWAVDTMFYAIPKNKNNVRFLYFVASTIPFKFYSTSTALPSMTQSDLNNHKVSLPSIEEQNEIVEYIEGITKKLDTAISLKEQEIEKLKEYKATLINSAVTGKIKVS